MKSVELVRWGLPLAVLVGFFKLSGAAVSFAFAAIVFALISAAIAWHKRDPRGFHTGVRAWIIILLIVPAGLAVLATAIGFPPALLLSVPALALAIWLYRLNARKIERLGPIGGSAKGSY
jgi:hypothetical protein